MYTIREPDKFRNNIKNMICKITENDNYSKNIEIGIYNSSLQIAKDRNIVRSWDNNLFVQI